MDLSDIRNRIFVAVVEDNNDPKKLGRCRCRVMNIFDEIPIEDIPWASPWKDLNGNQFILPEKGKIVSVVFDEGNIYKPEYIYAEHYNANLEKKLSSLSSSDYTSMRALMFDHKTQIYSNDSEGLKMDYKLNNVNIKDDSINLNLKDNFGKVNIGSDTSSQQAILGNHFLNWFDKFLNTVVVNGHLGNLAAPIVPTPALLDVLSEYYTLREPKFLSHHVNIVDNEYVNVPEWISNLFGSATNTDRITNGQSGDSWKSTVKNNNFTSSEPVPYTPRRGVSTDTPKPESGDLTTSSNQNGVTNANNIASNPGPISPTNNPDVIAILETMKSKGYVILSRPYEMNIIGLRRQYEGSAYSNAFKDEMYLIYKIDDTDNWEIKKYPISTMPGYYKAVEIKKSDGSTKTIPAPYGYKLKAGESWAGNTPKGTPIDIKSTTLMQGRGGMGILKPAQYINVYQIGTHGGAAAMTTLGPQKAYRDKTPGNIIKYTSETEGYFGMFIHRGYLGGVSVDNWSEGCQVFSKSSDLEDFFKWCNKHKERYGNKFNHTLMEERDVLAVKERLEEERAAAEAEAAAQALAAQQSVPPTTPQTEAPEQISTQQPTTEDVQPEPSPTEGPANLTTLAENIFDNNGQVSGIRVFISNNGKVIRKQDYSSVNYTTATALNAANVDISFGIVGDDGRFYKQGEVPR